MKDFNQLSGPWVGASVQDGQRIMEALRLRIDHGRVEGAGHDRDGDFEVEGQYSERNHRVVLTRRYTHTTEPSQESVGTPYDYFGHWDGAMVSGRWHPRSVPEYGGPFEMWPDREEDRLELAIGVNEQEREQHLEPALRNKHDGKAVPPVME